MFLMIIQQRLGNLAIMMFSHVNNSERFGFAGRFCSIIDPRRFFSWQLRDLLGRKITPRIQGKPEEKEKMSGDSHPTQKEVKDFFATCRTTLSQREASTWLKDVLRKSMKI